MFTAEAREIVRTPYRDSNANASAERCVRLARAECLDHERIADEAHPRLARAEYVAFYNEAQSH